MKKKEVQAELAKLGLPTKGRLAVLKEALQEARQMAEADGDGGDAGDSDAPTRQKSKVWPLGVVRFCGCLFVLLFAVFGVSSSHAVWSGCEAKARQRRR